MATWRQHFYRNCTVLFFGRRHFS